MSTFTPAETAACTHLIELALREDFGDRPWSPAQDPTTALCLRAVDGSSTAAIVVRQAGVVAGLPAVALVCAAIDPCLTCEFVFQDGQAVKAGDVLAHLRGPMSAILGAERTALNFLQHLSGIASLTHRYVHAVAGLPARILDTRKTIPGWRRLAKYAVRQGGGHNHRMGLHDGILIKDNHLAHALSHNKQSSIDSILNQARRQSVLPIEIEVDTLEQLDEALRGRPDIVLLDNMTLGQMREAVRRRNAVAPGIALEASGGVNLHTVRGIAETGVERISVGALTHSAPALDIGLDY